jgi:hypothetical protein
LVDDGSYIVLDLSVTVSSAPDNFYDLVFYEWDNGGNVYMDLIIIGISNDASGSSYYEVFNWGDNEADTNSNVSDLAAGGENDDETIPLSDPAAVPPSPDTLHDPDYDPANGTNGPLPQTGVLIDVDNAASKPPPGTYKFVVIISPSTGTGGGSANVDAIQATEVPISPPPPLPDTNSDAQENTTQAPEEPSPPTEEPLPPTEEPPPPTEEPLPTP